MGGQLHVSPPITNATFHRKPYDAYRGRGGSPCGCPDECDYSIAYSTVFAEGIVVVSHSTTFLLVLFHFKHLKQDFTKGTSKRHRGLINESRAVYPVLLDRGWNQE